MILSAETLLAHVRALGFTQPEIWKLSKQFRTISWATSTTVGSAVAETNTKVSNVKETKFIFEGVWYERR